MIQSSDDSPFEDLIRCAEQGDPEAQYTLAGNYTRGEGVAEELRSLNGVQDVVSGQPGKAGRVVATVTVGGTADLRPEIFTMAKDRGWVLYELHEEAGSLEDLFLQLTADPSEPEPVEAAEGSEAS